MWEREDLINVLTLRGIDKEIAAIKVDRCLEKIREEPILVRMYLHDMLGLDFGYIDVKEIENGEAGYCENSNEA